MDSLLLAAAAANPAVSPPASIVSPTSDSALAWRALPDFRARRVAKRVVGRVTWAHLGDLVKADPDDAKRPTQREGADSEAKQGEADDRRPLEGLAAVVRQHCTLLRQVFRGYAQTDVDRPEHVRDFFELACFLTLSSRLCRSRRS
jgi:hypothetical protein